MVDFFPGKREPDCWGGWRQCGGEPQVPMFPNTNTKMFPNTNIITQKYKYMYKRSTKTKTAWGRKKGTNVSVC